MRSILAIACLFSIALISACGGGAPPCPAGENLTAWQFTGSVEVDPACPSRVTVHLPGGTAAYIEKVVTGPVSAEAVLSAACDPADGIATLGISEAGAGVASQRGQLASQTLRASWAVAGSLGVTIGLQAAHACDVGVGIVVR